MLPSHEKSGGARGVKNGSAPGGARTGFCRRDPLRKEHGGELRPRILSEKAGYACATETAAATTIGAPVDKVTSDAAADEAGATIACCRRSLLMRASYGGMAFDQALLKGACLAWGERSGHCTPRPATASDRATFSSGGSSGSGSGSGGRCRGGDGGGDEGLGDGAEKNELRLPTPPPPPPISKAAAVAAAACRGAPPFGYVCGKLVSSWERGGWTGFLAAAHAGAGMPEALRWQLMAHVVGGGRGGRRVGSMDRAKRALGVKYVGEGEAGQRPRERAGEGEGGASDTVVAAEVVGVDVAGGGGLTAASTAAATDTKNAVVAAVLAQRQRGPILREQDAILSGVDFHCSSVLDELLRSPALAARVAKTEGSSRRSCSTGIGVKEAARQAMWACSSGLNVRRFQVAFSPGGRGVNCEKMGGRNDRCASVPLAYLAETRAVVGAEGGVGVSETDARVWAALLPDVLDWTRRFVRAKLAPGAMKNC